MEQQCFGFCRVESSIREQRAKLKAPWDRIVRLHSPNPHEKYMRIVTLSDGLIERPDGFVPSFGGETLKNSQPCDDPIKAMSHGIQSLHRGFVTVTDIGPYLDVALYRPEHPIIVHDDTGECIHVIEMHFSQ